MNETSIDSVLQRVITAIDSGSYDMATIYLDQSPEYHDYPIFGSYRAYCLAKGQGRIREAISLCRNAIQRDQHDPRHYLILGRLLVLAGQKPQAIKIFRAGLKHGRNADIIQELKHIGSRKPQVFSSLDRAHPLNRIAGKLVTLVGLR